VSVSNLATDYAAKKISFTVTWTAAPYNNQIWVITDYIKVENATTVGGWSRATVTAVTKTAGTGSATTATGNLGFWLNTSGSSGSANVTATVSLASGVDKFNWCAFALNHPPQAVIKATGGYDLKGTPPFTVNDVPLAATATTYGAGTCITSLSDATNNPTSVLPDPPAITLTSANSSQTVTAGSAIAQIKYTTTNATGATPSNLPTGVSGAWSSNVYTVSGTPTSSGTYNYTVTTTNSNGCANASASGTIAVLPTGCKPSTFELTGVGFANSATYTRNGITLSAPVTVTTCQKTTYNSGSSVTYQADCRTNPSYAGDLFSWCMVKQYESQLCPYPWRVPTYNDFCNIAGLSANCQDTVYSIYPGMEGWLLGGYCDYDAEYYIPGVRGYYWSSTSRYVGHAHAASTAPHEFSPYYPRRKNYGFSLRCVR
jgi:hypothetical protein